MSPALCPQATPTQVSPEPPVPNVLELRGLSSWGCVFPSLPMGLLKAAGTMRVSSLSWPQTQAVDGV